MKWPKPHFQEFPHCNPHWKQPWCGVTGWTNFSAIFLFLLSFLHDLATIGTVAGVSDNFLIFWTALQCPTQTTSKQRCFFPNKCHSWQSRHICWYATYDTLLSYIHTTLHFTALYYTAHILHSSMIFVVPPQGYGPRRSTWALFISPVSWLFMNKNLYTFFFYTL